jgi:hypothetical protein
MGTPFSEILTATAVATELQLDPPTQAGKSWLSVEGIVQDASKSRVTLKTREGFTLPRRPVPGRQPYHRGVRSA